jgi:hypothetical protein
MGHGGAPHPSIGMAAAAECKEGGCYKARSSPRDRDSDRWMRTEDIDWSLTTWEGARREQRRRWARMPLSEMIRALEEMQVLAERLAQPSHEGASVFRNE